MGELSHSIISNESNKSLILFTAVFILGSINSAKVGCVTLLRVSITLPGKDNNLGAGKLGRYCYIYLCI